MSAPDEPFPFFDVLPPGRHGAMDKNPVRIAMRRRTLLQFSARRGHETALRSAIQDDFGIALPSPGHAVTSGALTALWLQPGRWLLQGPAGAKTVLARRLAMGGFSSVVDQTHGSAILCLSGERAREVLARLCRLDLHPRVFGPGRAASTIMADISVVLHQRDDTPEFELLIPSSFFVSFATALRHAADAVGYEIVGAT